MRCNGRLRLVLNHLETFTVHWNLMHVAVLFTMLAQQVRACNAIKICCNSAPNATVCKISLQSLLHSIRLSPTVFTINCTEQCFKRGIGTKYKRVLLINEMAIKYTCAYWNRVLLQMHKLLKMVREFGGSMPTSVNTMNSIRKSPWKIPYISTHLLSSMQRTPNASSIMEGFFPCQNTGSHTQGRRFCRLSELVW